VKFHANYPDQSPEITVVESANVDDVSSFENEIQKIVKKFFLNKISRFIYILV
jgi:hypothetical protein